MTSLLCQTSLWPYYVMNPVGWQRCLPFATLPHSQGVFGVTSRQGDLLHLVVTTDEGVDREQLNKRFLDDLKRPIHVPETSTNIYNAMQKKHLPLAHPMLDCRQKWQVNHETVVLFCFSFNSSIIFIIWVRSRNCGCFVTRFCYQLIAKLSQAKKKPSCCSLQLSFNYHPILN